MPDTPRVAPGDRVVVVAGYNTGSVGHIVDRSDDGQVTVQRLTGKHVRAAADAVARVTERDSEHHVLRAARDTTVSSAQYSRLSADLRHEARAETLAAIDHDRIADLRATQQQAQARIEDAEQRHDTDTADLRRQLDEATGRLVAATADDRATIDQVERQVLATVAAGLGVDVEKLTVSDYHSCDSPVGACIYAKDDWDEICLICGHPDERK